MAANQKPLHQIGIFWYQFTPRKLLYLNDITKFGQIWSTLAVRFFWATLYWKNYNWLRSYWFEYSNHNLDGHTNYDAIIAKTTSGDWKICWLLQLVDLRPKKVAELHTPKWSQANISLGYYMEIPKPLIRLFDFAEMNTTYCWKGRLDKNRIIQFHLVLFIIRHLFTNHYGRPYKCGYRYDSYKHGQVS